jgi:hypothetical protein
MDDVLAFQSASFPAARAGDPDASEFEAAGIECLKCIVEEIRGDALAVEVPPLAEDSGCSAIVRWLGTGVVLHLEWFPAGPPRGQQRDVWTLQVWPSGWLHRLLPRGRRRSDDAARAVAAAVERVLRERTAEFSEVRRCTWQDLER